MSRSLTRAGLGLVLVGACVTGPGAPSPTVTVTSTTIVVTTTTSLVDPMTALADFESCLDGVGLDVEPIPLDSNGRPRFDLVMPNVDFSDAAQVTAFTECARELSDGALALDLESELAKLVLEALQDYANCVREHGVPDFPDPHSDFDGTNSPFPMDSIPFGDPALETAASVCAERLGG